MTALRAHFHHENPAPAALPVACDATAASPTTTPPTTTTPPRRYIAGSALPPPEPDGDHAEDEDAIFRDPYVYGTNSERRLTYTALPLRHRIYALHCQGRTISAIARQLRLDRGTVSRHLHAAEDLLLAEQTHDLARLRLRAIEAQHAVLAAAWDALLYEEEQEHSYERERENDRADYTQRIPQPARSRRAHLLATAARAARTAAQLQGLFTPAALQAALATAQCDHPPAPTLDAASCGMPASATASPAASEAAHGHAPAAYPTTPPTSADYPRNSIAAPAPSLSPAIAERRPPACVLPLRVGVGTHGDAPKEPGERSTHRPFIAAATAAVRRAVLQ